MSAVSGTKGLFSFACSINGRHPALTFGLPATHFCIFPATLANTNSFCIRFHGWHLIPQ